MAETTVAILYGRVSTQDQARTGYSLPDQMRQCAAKALTLGATQTIPFEDAIDGDFLDRPGLDAARDLIRRGNVRWFICADPDRFSRTLMNQLLITDEIEKAGVALVFTQHNYEKTPEGQLFYQMRGAIAQFEKAKIKERTARGKREKLRQGKLAQGAIPYGYRFDTDADELRPHPHEAPAVLQIFLWASDGIGAGKIADRLNDLKVQPRRGQKWFRSRITFMLRNTSYIGQMACNRWVITPKSQQDISTKSQRPAKEWAVIPVPVLVPVEIFNAVQALLKRVKYQRRGSMLLSGLVVCNLCGANMSYHPHPRGYYNFVCQNRYPDSTARLSMPVPCRAPIQKAEHFEKGVWDLIRRWVTNPDEHAQYLCETYASPDLNYTATLQTELKSWQEALAEAQAEQANTITFLSKRLIDSAVAESKLAEAMERINAIREKINGVEGELRSLADSTQRITRLAEQSNNFALLKGSQEEILANMDTWTLEGRRTAIRKLISRVRVGPKKWFRADAL